MQQVILGLLILHGPLSLYAVQRQFQQGVSLFYSASFGSIQRALKQLAEQGLATVADVRRRRPRQQALHRDGCRTPRLAGVDALARHRR